LLPNLVDPLREKPAQTGLEQPALAFWPASDEFGDLLEAHADALGTVDEGQFIERTRIELPVAVGCSSGGGEQPDPLVEADGRRRQPGQLSQFRDLKPVHARQRKPRSQLQGQALWAPWCSWVFQSRNKGRSRALRRIPPIGSARNRGRRTSPHRCRSPSSPKLSCWP
jgi:hypothetical protein